MFYKVSNTTSLNTIESELNSKFRFPNLYEVSPIIDGLNEVILPVITNSNSKQINFGIWGMLPKNYKEDWSFFQKVKNTLNLDIRNLGEDSDYYKIIDKRRCVVLVSGFFTSYNYRGQIYPVYVYPKKTRVFALAAIYNKTHDGFITFTILLKKSNYQISQIHNISDSMPIVLDNELQNKWLGDQFSHIIWGDNDSYNELDFSSHTIAKEFYKNNIVFESILEPAIYQDLINF